MRFCCRLRNWLVAGEASSILFIFRSGIDIWQDRRVNVGRHAVLQTVNKAGLSVIDMHPVFMAQKDPLNLFPLRSRGYVHYSEEGHRLVAEEVLRSMPPPKPTE